MDVQVEPDGKDKYLINFISPLALSWAQLHLTFLDRNRIPQKIMLQCTREQMHHFAYLMFDAELEVNGADEFQPVMVE